MIATAIAPTARPARLVIADGRPRARAALRRAVRRSRSVVVTGEASTASVAAAAVGALRPDLVLVDLCLPGLDSVDLLRGVDEDVDVLAQVAHDDRASAVAALRAGAAGVVQRDASRCDVVRALEALVRGVVPLFLYPTPRSLVPRKEDPMVTPKVVELSRGCAHAAQVRRAPAPVAAAARKG
jgi:DNA-binding NarL/FixJ family response regulator